MVTVVRSRMRIIGAPSTVSETMRGADEQQPFLLSYRAIEDRISGRPPAARDAPAR
jgi:hypothetical protein